MASQAVPGEMLQAITRTLDPLYLLHDKDKSWCEKMLTMPSAHGTPIHCASAHGRIECLRHMLEVAAGEPDASLKARLLEVILACSAPHALLTPLFE